MSKRKRRRQRRSQRPNLPAQAVTAERAGQRFSQRDVIPTDYAHVIADLKRIALFGGLLLAVLITLSFIIQ